MQIPNATTLTDKQKEDLVTFICYKNQKNNIMNLRKAVGDSGLLSLLNMFAGTYMRFPTISVVVSLANQLHLIELYDQLLIASGSGNPKIWQEHEDRFVKFASNKFDMEYLPAKHFVKKLKYDLLQAQNWYAGIVSWEKRHDKPDGK